MLDVLLREPSIRIVSFDVFDTALTRLTAQPRGVFMMMSRSFRDRVAGLPEDFADRFCEYRIAAEKRARKSNPLGEITIDEIYRQLALEHDLERSLSMFISEIEIEQEHALIVPVPEIKEMIVRCREAGKKIIYVSDMYLPGKVVCRFLKSNGLFLENDTLYISSEAGLTKGKGGLFKHVLEKEGCLPSEVLHIGDNLGSDVICPQRFGILANHFTATSMTRYEQILLGEGDLTGQLLAGVARVSRLGGDSFAFSSHKVLNGLGAAVAGPIFTSYIAWIRSSVLQLGIRRLYFVSRDGQVLYEIARQVFRDGEVELRYLFGSRQAWHLPALTNITEYELDWLTIADPILSVQVLAGRILLDPVAVQEALQEEGLLKDLDTAFSDEEIGRLKETLAGHTRLSRLIKAKAGELKQDAIGYFRQEGLFDQVPWAIVDLGWFGNMQDSLEKMLREAGREIEVRGYYLGLLKAPKPCVLKHSFLFSPNSDPEMFETGSCFVQIAELFACADHGTTIRYENKGNAFIPVLKDFPEAVDAWGIRHLRSGILNFVECSKQIVDWKFSNELTDRILFLMRTLFFAPEREEAIALGDYLFSSDQGETALSKFAPPLTLNESLKYLRLFGDSRKFQVTFWIHGSRVRSNVFINAFLSICSAILRLWNSVFRLRAAKHERKQ